MRGQEKDERAGERWEEGEVMGFWSKGRVENGGPDDFIKETAI